MSGTDGGGGPDSTVENPNVPVEIALRTITPPQFSSLQPKPASERTDFEPYSLNQMVDLVDGAQPSDLENVGDALYAASSAIRKAGAWLAKEAPKVRWRGKAADSFQKWATQLGQDTEKMGEYAESISTELSILSTSLTSVKNSMPERSEDEPTSFTDEGGKKGLESIPSPKRVDGNKKVQYEKDRSSAIELMNQLSSYYSVSQEAFDRAENGLPHFRPMPNMGVPVADYSGADAGLGQGTRSADPMGAGSVPGPGKSGVPGQPLSVEIPGGDRGIDAIPSGSPSGGDFTPQSQLDSTVSTDINTAAPPMTHSGGPPTAPPPSVGPSAGPTPLGGPPSGFPPPGMAPPTSKMAGGPLRKPVTPPVQGGLGRPNPTVPGPTGRPGATGPRGLGTGPLGPGGKAVGSPNGPGGMGRPGMMGPGMTGPGGATGAGNGLANGGARAARPGGIVGGTPTRTTPGGNASRIPRGTVVGGEGITGRPPVGMARTGGTGRGTGAAQNGSSRRVASNPGGIVGTPRSGASGQGRDQREFTPGGSGLVRNAQGGGTTPPGSVSKDRKRSRNESRRPDYLTEDEEMWSTGQPGGVPPVIE